MKKILHITNCFPVDTSPDYGIFVKEQIVSLEPLVENRIIFINARELGVAEYFFPGRVSDFIWADIIHCHHFLSFLAVFPLAVTLRKKLVLSFLNEFKYELKFNIPSVLKVALIKAFILFTDKYIMKSSSDLNHPKAIYLPNGVVVPKDFRSCSFDRKENRPFRLLFVASKNPNRHQKRYDIFQKVCDILVEKYSLEVEPIVASGLPRPEFLELLESCHLHVLVSDYEGSPNSVKEAMAHNVPVVSRDVGNVRAMFSMSNSKFYQVINSADPNNLADACFDILSSDWDVQNDGVELVRLNRLGMEQVALDLLEVYEGL